MSEIQALVVDNSPVIRRILSYVLEAKRLNFSHN